MGTKRVGLARFEALLENLKRALNLGTATITVASVTTTTGDVDVGNDLKVSGGRLQQKLEAHDIDAQNATVSAANFKKGLINHTSTSSAGVITIDTAANLISTLNLTADDMTAHCYYVNDGNQDVTMSGSVAGITYQDAAAKIKANGAAILLARRTGSSAVKMYIIGGQV